MSKKAKPSTTGSQTNQLETKQPLAGLRILVGRARHQADDLSAQLRKLGARVIAIPFIEIRQPTSFQTMDFALKNLGTYDWLILTSVNGVESMWDRLAKLRLTKRALRQLRIAAIGPGTQKAIEQRGVKVDLVPKEYIAESVVRSLKNKVKGKRVLLVRAKVARDVIPRKLRKAGAHVDVAEAYETVVPQSSRRRVAAVLDNPRRRPHLVTFTSSSTVRNFVELLRRHTRPGVRAVPTIIRRSLLASLAGITLASIGPVTSSTLREFGLPVDIEAKEFTIPGLVQAITISSR